MFILRATPGRRGRQEPLQQPVVFVVASSSDGTRLAAAINGGQIAISMNSGTNWTNYGPSKFWSSVTASANGTKFAAAVNGEYIYTSVNSRRDVDTQQATSLSSAAVVFHRVVRGRHESLWRWSTTGLILHFDRFGRHVVEPEPDEAVVFRGVVVGRHGNSWPWRTTITFTRPGDSGANWTQRATSLFNVQPWVTVSSSGNGTCLVAVVNNGLIYNSFDSGQTWTARTSGNQPWYGVCVSTDGTRAAAAINGGQVYTSTSATTAGTGGYLMGSQYSGNIELQYIGNGQ